MSGYTKLFHSILTSTIWRASHPTRIVWITLLALADRHGVVEASLPGLADMARVTVEECQAAVRELEGPDEWSRTQNHEGRRIEPIDGGWRILNHGKYREKLSDEAHREYNRIKQAESRQRRRRPGIDVGADGVIDTSMTLIDKSSKSAKSNKAEADPDPDPDQKGEEQRPPASVLGAEALQSSWNEVTSEPLPRCLELTPERRRLAEARLRSPGLDVMREHFARINTLPFCRGENGRGWCADFDWGLTRQSITKVREGSYTHTRGPSRGLRTAREVRQATRDGNARAVARLGIYTPGSALEQLDGEEQEGEA